MGFFNVITKSQTWLNIIYLLLSYPLGLFYFIFLIVGLAVGFGLVIIWIGIPILLLMMWLWWGLMHFERMLANKLLKANIPHLQRADPEGKLWDQFRAHLKHELTWRGLLHLILRFPLGLISFIALITLGTLSFTLISIPLFIWIAPAFIYEPEIYNSTIISIASLIIGVFLLFGSLHAWNGLAYVQRAVAQALLNANEKEWEAEEKRVKKKTTTKKTAKKKTVKKTTKTAKKKKSKK